VERERGREREAEMPDRTTGHMPGIKGSTIWEIGRHLGHTHAREIIAVQNDSM
jgi:hypothetical protein